MTEGKRATRGPGADLEAFRREAGVLPGPAVPLGEGAAGPAEAGGRPGEDALPRVAVGPEVPAFRSSACTLAEVMAFRDEAFVLAAYRAALGRDPDPGGRAAYLEALRSGSLNRLEVLGTLRYSPEGRALGRAILGLWARHRLARVGRIPLLGPALLTVAHLFRLPAAQRYAEAARDQAAAGLTALAAHQNLLAGTLEGLRRRQGAREEQLLRRLEALEADRLHIETRLAETAAAVRASHEAVEALRTSQAAADAVGADLATKVDRLSRDGAAGLRQIEARLQEQGRLLAEARAALDGLSAGAEALALEQRRQRADSAAGLDRVAARVDEAVSGEREARLGALSRVERQVEALRPVPFPTHLYGALQEQFRGQPSLVRSHLTPYLPHVRDAGAGTTERPVLDLGCGRGEWLSLLRDEGLVATGVDQREETAAACREQGLRVQTGEALAHLRELPPGCLGAVTAFHLVEHLPVADLLELLGRARRALAPGGLLLLETPDPANLRVGACYFYLDPTHQKPIPSELLLFLVGEAGFVSPRHLPLHPFPAEEWPEGAGPLAPLLFGPRDYAVLARVPGEV